MNDLISRQAVLKGISLSCTGQSDVIKAEAALVRYVKKIPSAEPERKKGFWIIENEFLGDCIDRCSVCGWKYSYYGFDDERDDYNFCPNCGADMRGGEDEQRTEARNV